jgi:hypothetical protein
MTVKPCNSEREPDVSRNIWFPSSKFNGKTSKKQPVTILLTAYVFLLPLTEPKI